jgi:hypothetical protein
MYKDPMLDLIETLQRAMRANRRLEALRMAWQDYQRSCGDVGYKSEQMLPFKDELIERIRNILLD